MIAFEGRSLSDAACKAAFTRMRARIDAIASLYCRLTQTRSIDTVTAESYLTALVEDAVSSSPQADTIAVEFDLPEVRLSTRIAVPLGLIVKELVTNSLKYPYHGRSSGWLGLRLSIKDQAMKVSVWDDRPGIDPDARLDPGLGQKLTDAFTAQLSERMSIDSGAAGTRHTLVLPLLTASSKRSSGRPFCAASNCI
ncbi:sensor histidine kinase [Pseudoroseicyclus tamaricis]|nr:sensor histidine kinase [Pseudoroseicyclus tamaricis]